MFKASISSPCFRKYILSRQVLPSTRKIYTDIAECYKGKSVFITGGTGFLGKVLVEKLLYSCPGIDKIYLLVREKQDATPRQRILKFLDQPLFTRIKEEKPQVLEKIIPIVGDISEPQLGMKADDEDIFADKVSVVFHVAATTKFNEPFEEAMNINVLGTDRVLSLAKRMKNIQAFVHVSTAYSNTDKKIVEEVIYPAPASMKQIKKLLETGISESQVKTLINGRPNTYTFTKALAENLVADNHGHVPAVIIKPSVVSSSQNEPVIGWIDNWYGVTAVMTSIMKGRNRVLLSKPDNILDLVPVDYVSNLIIVAAARCKCSETVDVYNSCTSDENPLAMRKFIDIILAESRKHKFYDVPIPMLIMTQYKWLVLFTTLLFQTVPAYTADMFMLLRGKKTRFVKIQSRVSFARDTLEYFSINNWIIRASQTRALAKSLSPSDRLHFPCDPTDIDWNKYIPIYCQGIRQYLCKT